MKKNFFTFFVVGLLVLMSGSVSAQSYGINAEKAAYMLNGDFLTDPALDSAYIGADKGATVSIITSGHADSVYFGMEAVHAVFTDDAEGKDRLEFKLKTPADMHMWNSGILTFWIKLNDTLDMHFEVNANRDGAMEAKGSDASMEENFGLNRMDTVNWQMITIDLAKDIKGDNFTYDIFESFGFRSRGNACDFLIDEMHVEFYGAYGIYTDRVGWMTDGDFLTDLSANNAFIAADKNATVRMITNGDADSVMFGQNAIYVNLTDNAEGKDRLEIKVEQDANVSEWNYGKLVFYLKLLAPTIDINFEMSANRSGAMEAKGNDISMKEEMGLDTNAVGVWQKFEVELSEPFGGDDFAFDIFESFSFRSREHASEFIVDEIHVVLGSGYGMNADKPAYMAEGDFLTDPWLVEPTIAEAEDAVVRMITSGGDSTYYGDNAIYVNLSGNTNKDRLEYKLEEDADMTFFNNGTLIFWIKLLAPCTDINFEVSANRENAGESKGNDISMKNELGLDVDNDSTWQKIMVDLTAPIDGDFFTFDIFESLGFRSRANASEFIVDEMHVMLTTPLARFRSGSTDATLKTLTVSPGVLTPAFDPGTTAYTVDAAAADTLVTVAAEATDANATVTGIGDVDISSGIGTATVAVVAEDGWTRINYVVEITRAASVVLTLDTLIVSVGDLTPAFSSETTAYTLEAPPGTTTVTVTAVPTDASATVTGTGDIDISSGSAKATVTVSVAGDPSTMEYVIDITRSNVDVEEDMLAGVSIYPNPVSTKLIVELGDNEVGRVDVINLLGQKVISKSVQSQRMVFDVSDLSEGIYVVALDGVPYSKIVIRK